MVLSSVDGRRGRWPVLWAVSGAFLLSGCASAKYIQTGPSAASKPDDCTIEVFTSRIPDRPYEELGIIEGEGSFGSDSLEEVLPKMKVEACKAGGDAIILGPSQRVGDDLDTLDVTATVIRWTGSGFGVLGALRE